MAKPVRTGHDLTNTITTPPMIKEYWLSLTKTYTPIYCPVEGFPRRDTSSPNLWLYFMHQHTEDTIIILNEGTAPHPWCKQWDVFVPRWKLMDGNIGTRICRRGVE